MRVIAGTARGKSLRAPRTAPTRPTADIVRGAIFSMLEAEAYKRGEEPDGDGQMAAARAWPTVLDLYAGSGAMGIEALSRGAQRAVLVEQNAEACQAISANLTATGLADRAQLRREPVERALNRLDGPFDLVLIDPPYTDDQSLASVSTSLARPGLLAASAVLIVEQGATAVPADQFGGGVMMRTRTHGKTRITLYAIPQ